MEVSGPHPLHLIFALAPVFARVKRGKLRSSLFAPRKRLLRRLQSSVSSDSLDFVFFCHLLFLTFISRRALCLYGHVLNIYGHLRSLKDVRGNLTSEYFCWMFGDPHFFFGRSLPLLILSIILKNKKSLYVGSFNYFSYTI